MRSVNDRAASSDEAYTLFWTELVATISAAMLADSRGAPEVADGQVDEDELLDLALICACSDSFRADIAALLETAVVPRFGDARVADDVIRAFASTVQRASRLYTLDLPPTPPTTPSAREARFVDDFDAHSAVVLAGTTARVIETPRERVAYWSLDLLIVLCSCASRSCQLS